MKKHLWLRTGILLSIPLVLGLVLLHIKSVRDRANVPLQNIVIPRTQRSANGVQALTFSPDGQRLAFTDMGGSLRIWDIKKNDFVRVFDFPSAYEDQAIAWRNDDRIVSGNHDSIKVTNIANGKLESTLRNTPKNLSYQAKKDRYAQCSIAPKANWAALGEVYGTISVWDTRTDKLQLKFETPNKVTCNLAFSDDGKTVAVASLLFNINPRSPKRQDIDRKGAEISLRDTQTGALQNVLSWSNAYVTPDEHYQDSMGDIGLAFSPDGKVIAGVAANGLCIWQVSNGQQLYVSKEDTVPLGGGKKTIAFSPDGSLIAGIGWGKKIYVLATQTGEILQEFNGNSDFTGLKSSPDGKLLATGGQDNSGQAVVKIWDVANMN